VIRPAGPGDVAAIHGLVRELAEYEKSLDQVVASPDDIWRALFGERPAVFAHVAEHEGAVAGFALWFLNYSTWTGRHGIYLEDLCVTPRLRGHGYGKALLAELARICAERGYARFEWAVLDWNTPAIGFYRALGAAAMDEWTVQRLAGPALHALAEQAPGQAPGQTPGQTPGQAAGEPPR
jgi:GNAT superfamily N-acetyltransferase